MGIASLFANLIMIIIQIFIIKKIFQEILTPIQVPSGF